MADQKETKSKPEKESQSRRFDCCGQNFDEMFKKMQEFCGSKEKAVDCCDRMQQMFSKNTEKPHK